MADVAHDAPASPKPGEIAPQQASRSDSADRDKLRVFISYSRDDLNFANQLNAALDAYGFECFIDREGISGGEKWKRRIGSLISEADTVVFVLSPTSSRSEICAWEVEEAARLNKRILPVNCRPLEGTSPPPRLRDLNHIFFYEDRKVKDSGFGTGLKSLVAALNTDFDWLREHTRYLQRAIEWNKGDRPANRLLSGDDIAEAKAWVARRPKNAPEPTALHLDFIRASEEEAEARSSAQRKQLETMNDLLTSATDIIVELQGQMDINTKKKVFAVFQRGADHGDARSMSNLGVLYAYGQGVAQDYAKAREWFEKAADKGEAYAMVSLGLLYANGQGVAQDYVKARELYEKAADKGAARAMRYLGVLYANGQGVAQDYAKARELYEKAADKGDAYAMVNLGLLYANGQGVAQDYAKAREWYEKAADKGDAEAKARLEQLPIREAVGAGRYAEALQLQEALAVKVQEAETKREGNPAKETAQALIGVTWYALFAREFTKALTVADRVHALFPDNLSIETNRAHALMFLGHEEESKAVYFAHKGKPLSGQDGQLWERAIAEDFEEFRKAGLTHPMMADIEKELGVSR
jgi:TPR repeat protein